MSGSTAPESMNSTEAETAIESLLDDSLVEETEQPETDSEEVTGQPEEATESEEETEETEEVETSEDEEQDSIETLAELAEALDLPLEEVLANLKTTVKVNGEEIPVTLKEAFDGYQKDADYRNKTTELANQRSAFEEQSARARQQLEQQLLQLGQFVEQAEKMFVPALDPTQMEYLKQTDPQQYLIKQQERNEQLARIQQLRQEAANHFAANQQALQEQQAKQMQEVLQAASEDLATRIPTWSKDVKTQVDDYLTGDNFGYTPEELSQVVDPRLVEIAWKAMQFDQQASKADVVKKKVRTLPKIQSKGSAKPVNANAEKLQKARARLQKSGSLDDAAALVAELNIL